MSPLGLAVSNCITRQFDAVKTEIMAGGFAAIKCPLKNNAGNTLGSAGEARVETDIALESMDYLVEGVIGSTS